jgi:DNA modification methylase
MKMTTELVMRPVDSLIPYARNARIHSESQIVQLRASLREFGFVAPLLIDQYDNVIAGHGRLAAAKAEGLISVPCVLVEHLSDTQRKAYILADNRLAEQANWDTELVSLELQELSNAGFDIDITGFESEDIIIEESTDVEEDDFDPVLPKEPKARPGEIYILGRHRLMCGDATKTEDILFLMSEHKADLFLTDPPYNVDITGGTGEHFKIKNDDMDDAQFCNMLGAAFSNAVSVMNPGAGFYIWHSDGASGLAFRKACVNAGLAVRQCLIWVKQSATIGRQDYQWQHEPCLHGQTEAEELDEPSNNWDSHEACLYGWKDGKPHLWRSDRKQTTVLEFDRPTRSEEHPTMKPVKLFGYEILNSTIPGAVVADFFAGSGSTVIACEQLGRSAFLMDIDPRCVDVIIERWEKFTGQKAVNVNGT